MGAANMISYVVVVFLLVAQCLAFEYEDMAEFFKFSGAAGTQHGKDVSKDDKQYYVSNSGVPHLPTMTGFMGTHGTYRFLTIHEQTAVLIGDGKHGVWRIQENGLIREYRKKGKVGIGKGVDPNKLNLQKTNDQAELSIIEHYYSHYIPEESWSGYKYPDQEFSAEGYLNWVDLSIYHPKYKGKYDSHVPIDLPHFYCTMTQNDYKHTHNVWKYATAQPRANKMGPLAVRAGMDIKENYFNVLRFDFFADAGVWSNVGTGNPATDDIVKNLDQLKARYQTLNYQRVDQSKVDIEVYLFERPFFNHPYIFITFVMDTRFSGNTRRSDYSYVRPTGAYYDALRAKGKTVTNTQPEYYPKAYVENYPKQGHSSVQKAYGLPTYGHHHPARHAHKLIGGACPNRGGDWGRYPWSNSGAGFPTNYEEITPICDAFVLDMKCWANLQVPSWADVNLFLGNSGFDGNLVVNYSADANLYGRYTDPYLANTPNPVEMDLTGNATIIEPGDKKLPIVHFRLNFGRAGKLMGFNNVSLPRPKQVKKEEKNGKQDVENGGKQMCNTFSLVVALTVFGVFVREV